MMKKILLLASLFVTLISFAQVIESPSQKNNDYKRVERIINTSLNKKSGTFEQRLANGGIRLRGNMTFIANNNLSRKTAAEGPNIPYNDTGVNNDITMGYIDVDGYVDENLDGKDDTFSSSTATLALPNCSRVVYAGLYWAGVYGYIDYDDFSKGKGGEEYRDIKFKLPSSTNYIDISATDNNREVLGNINDAYVCFKDITDLVKAEPNPNGIYTGANVNGTIGRWNDQGGAGGWTMIIIYENDKETKKNISIFDGYTIVSQNNNQEVGFSGFKTIPAGNVEVEQILGALEGDWYFKGDKYNIKNPAGNYVEVFNNLNPSDNFFRGNISIYDTDLSGRTPNSTNTLGFDVDQFKINNTSNAIIENNQTSAEVEFTSDGDTYWPFLNALSVEIIEPEIKLIKTVEDTSGNTILNTDLVALDTQLYYNISFQSVGTDNAIDTEIVDLLPKNVNLIPGDIVLSLKSSTLSSASDSFLYLSIYT